MTENTGHRILSTKKRKANSMIWHIPQFWRGLHEKVVGYSAIKCELFQLLLSIRNLIHAL
jgi:hypothetical protein